MTTLMWKGALATDPPRQGGNGSTIQVRPDELIRTAAACEAISKNLKGQLDKLATTIIPLLSNRAFRGMQATALISGYTQKREKLESFPPLVALFGLKLLDAAQAFQIADSDDVTIFAATIAHQEILPNLPPHFKAEYQQTGGSPSFWDRATDWLIANGSKAKSAAMALKTLWSIDSPTKIVFRNGKLDFAGGVDGKIANSEGFLPKASSWVVSKSSPLIEKISPGKTAKILDVLDDPAVWAKYAKGMAVVGSLATVGSSIYTAIKGSNDPAVIAATISSGVVRAAMGYNPIGAAITAADTVIQFGGPIVADLVKKNAAFLAGGGLQEEHIRNAATNFKKSIQDISLDGRLTGAFTAIFKGDVGGVFNQIMTARKGIVGAIDSGSQVAGAVVGGLVNKIIPGAGGIVGTAVEVGIQAAHTAITLPLRIGNFAVDLFTGKAKVGEIVSGPGKFVGRLFDQVGLKGVGNVVRTVTEKVGGVITKIGQPIVNGIKTAAKKVVSGIKSVAKKIGNFFKKLF